MEGSRKLESPALGVGLDGSGKLESPALGVGLDRSGKFAQRCEEMNLKCGFQKSPPRREEKIVLVT